MCAISFLMPGCTHYGINGVKNALPALMLWRCGKEEFVADLAGQYQSLHAGFGLRYVFGGPDGENCLIELLQLFIACA